MPTYEYSCDFCRTIIEEVHSIKSIPDVVVCKNCGGAASRILSSVAVHCDSATWIDDGLRCCLQKDGEKPIETKSELNSYLKAHDIVQTG